MRVPSALQPLLRHTPLGGPPEDRVVLELDLGRGLLESPPTSPLEAVRARHTPLLRTLVAHLRKAERDPAVAGLVAVVGQAPLTLAQAGELRAAVASFRASGRPTLAWSPSFGELGPGTTGYHLAAAFDEVWLQPSGLVGLVGFAAEAVFLRGALDKLGVEPQIGRRHEYKSAAEMLTRSSISEPHREMLARLLQSATDTVAADVAADRGLSADDVRAVLDGGPLPAAQALERGLVDHLGYRDEAYRAFRERLGRSSLRYVERYGASPLEGLLGQVRTRPGRRPVVAVVQASGPILLGRPNRPPTGGPTVGSDQLGAVLRAAGRDRHVAAVVLRVDSPGGSYVGSDAIRRELLALREGGTPVVASMASVAASGGYYVAMGADAVYASAGTVTGSIGVLAGKNVLHEGLSRIGVERETVSSTPHAAMFSTDRPFDEDELALLDAWLDDVYADFTGKAAHDRGMTVEQLHEVARGRVWSGADALERGLVDSLGGLEQAVGEACRRAGVDRRDVDVRPFPRPNPVQALVPPESSESVGAAAAGLAPSGLAGLPEGPLAWQRLLGLDGPLGPARYGVLSLPSYRLPGLLPG